MKNIILGISLLFLLGSCSTVKNIFQPQKSVVSSQSEPSSQYIEHIEIKSPGTPASSYNSSASSGKNSALFFQTKNITSAGSAMLEMFSISQFKYAIRLDVPVELIQNKTLYDFIDDWWGVPYRMGGMTQKGIDCSAFMQTLFFGVFALKLPRTAREQKTVTEWIPMNGLREGDLVFFNTRGGVSHVGMYLHNNKFVHASTSSGVMISDLNDSYWSRKLIGAGRILQSILPRP
ncbi:MAG: NlpC/P60 family protein [Lacibacter sp.]